MDTRMTRLWQQFDAGRTDATTQADIADRLNVSKVTVHRYYTGERTPRLIGYGRLWGAVMGMRDLDWEVWADEITKSLAIGSGVHARLEHIDDGASYAAASRRAMGSMLVAAGIADGAILAQYMEVIP